MEVPPGTGQNPMNGVILSYYLKEKADTSMLTMEILEMNGSVIRRYTNKKDENAKPGNVPPPPLLPSEAGMNRFGWDYRTDALPDLPGSFIYGDMEGHRVAPGHYKARLKFKNEISETEFDLLGDPRLPVSLDDWKAQQQLLTQMEQSVKDMHNSILNMRKAKKQIEGYSDVLKNDPNAKELINTGNDIIKKIDKWESNLIEMRSKNFQDVINFRNRLNSEFLQVRSAVDAHDPRITQGVKDRLQDVQTDWDKSKKEMSILIQTDIKHYNQLFKEKNIPAVVTPDKDAIINN